MNADGHDGRLRRIGSLRFIEKAFNRSKAMTITTKAGSYLTSDTERTAGTPRRCGCSGKPIDALRPQARFCGDPCRARGRRQARDRRVAALLDAIAAAGGSAVTPAANEVRREL